MYENFTKITCGCSARMRKMLDGFDPLKRIDPAIKRKIVMRIKLVGLIVFTSIMQLSAATMAQRLTLSKKSASLGEVFREIRKQTGFTVLYDAEKLDVNQKVNAGFKGATLVEVLDRVLAQRFSYVIEEQNILIEKKVEKGLVEKVKDYFTQIDVTGKVVDDTGQPISGASILIKATGKGVSTGSDGVFQLKSVQEGELLIIKYLGFEVKEIKAIAALGTVRLKPTTNILDQVQIQAYGTTSRRLSTSNISTVKAEDIAKSPVSDPLLALQGRVTGVEITQVSGVPGGAISVRIQGQNSLANGNTPLYVIDGMPYWVKGLVTSDRSLGLSEVLNNDGAVFGSPLMNINPNDIESIDILKDADATAIYGSRAANGAILITTKKGKAGPITFDVNVENGIGQMSNRLKLLNTRQYLDMRYEAFKNDNINWRDASYRADDLKATDTLRFTDFQDFLIGDNASWRNIRLSASGGSSLTYFRIGATHRNESTITQGDFGNPNTSISFNLNANSANQKLQLSLGANYVIGKNTISQNPSALLGYSLTTPPTAPDLRNADGTINFAPNSLGSGWLNGLWDNSHPLAGLIQKYIGSSNTLLTNLNFKYQFIPSLSFSTIAGYSKAINNEKTLYYNAANSPYWISLVGPQAINSQSRNTLMSWNLEPFLTFAPNLSQGRISVIVGGTLNQRGTEFLSASGSGYTNDASVENLLAAPTLGIGNGLSEYKYLGVFSRLNYVLKDKYIINMNFRRDGSSRFGIKARFNDFWSLGTSWIFSDEDFFKKLGIFSFGKFNLSYGVTGSDQVGEYSFIGKYSSQAYTLPYQGLNVFTSPSLINPYLQWERNKKLNFGIDLGFVKDRILFSANYSINRSSNQLINTVTPPSVGAISVWENFPATIQNTSFQFSINTVNLKNSLFDWQTNFNFTIGRNRLLEFALAGTPAYSTLAIGQPISGRIRSNEFLGIDPGTGVGRYSDANGNPTANPVQGVDEINHYVDVNTKFQGGLSNTISFGKLSLSTLFEFRKRMVLDRIIGAMPQQTYPGSFGQAAEFHLFDHWQKPGDIAQRPRLSTNSTTSGSANFVGSDAGYIDGSYIRFKNMSLSYSLTDKFIRKLSLKDLRVYVQGQNLLTLTTYPGLDPETQMSMPALRTLTFGIQVKL